MIVLKWICFILVCLDTLGYIVGQTAKIVTKNTAAGKMGVLLGLCIGTAARVFVLYGTATCWLLN